MRRKRATRLVTLALFAATATAAVVGWAIPFAMCLKVAGGVGTDAWVYVASGGGGLGVFWVRDRHAGAVGTAFTLLPATVWRPRRLPVSPGGSDRAGWVDWYPGGGAPIYRSFLLVSRHDPAFGPRVVDCGAAAVPAWLPLIVLGIPPAAIWARAVRDRRRRANVGHCHRCGYDLRASPDRCPECGTRPIPV